MEAPALEDAVRLDCDVLVIGGGTAGTMAALTAAEHGAQVLLLEKAHVRHSGALAMGMDGVNNAVIPGKATPEDYVAEITRANDGIVNQRTIYQTATRGFAMVQRLERYGVKFEKDEHGEYAVRRVHRSGSYVLPMPEGKDVKKALYRVLRQRTMREKIRIENRLVPVRVLTENGRAVGAAALNSRTGEFVVGRRQSRHPRHRAVRAARAARIGIPVRHLRESDQRRRRLLDGVPRRCRTLGNRVLPDQSVDQGLQRPRLRLRRQSIRRLPGQRAGGAVRRLRLLVGADDVGGQERDRIGARAHLPQGQSPTRRDAEHARGHSAHHRAADPRHVPRQPRPRLPHPRHRDAHLRNRFVQRPFRLRRLGRRARAHHRSRSVRRGRPRLRAAQLHDRCIRLRRPGGQPRRIHRG